MDSQFSIEPKEMQQLVKDSNSAYLSIGNKKWFYDYKDIIKL